jgi:hypothetical protein
MYPGELIFMKRLISIVLFCLMASFAAPAYAGTFSFVPNASSVVVGDSVSFQVLVNGEGDPLVVSQFQLSYPPDLLVPTSFVFAPGWTQTFDVGTNIMAGGTVVQAGGYTATFKGSQIMGTLTFTAQKTGVATIALSKDNTYLFEGDSGGNLFSGPLSTARVSITPGANGVTSLNVGPSGGVAPAVNTNSASQVPNSPSSSISLWTVLFFILALLVLWCTYRIFKKRRIRKQRR